MLPLESQVCSLASAKRLKELNCRQESLFFWAHRYDENKFKIMSKQSPDLIKCLTDYGYSAFTVAELGEMLPSEVSIENGRCSLHMERSGGSQEFNMISYRTISHLPNHQRACFVSLSEAEARSRMLIYLIEQGLINAKKIK